jgi:diguanylate cyclase (GGDEF)-like protein/PAS domain S-box-containing protein
VLGQDLPGPLVDGQYLVAGLTLYLAVDQLLRHYRSRDDHAAFWLGCWSAALTAALLANIALFSSGAGQADLVLDVRATLLFVVVLLMIPTVAVISEQRTPRVGLGFLALLGGTRLALVLITKVVYAHRLGTGGVPVYGPLLAATTFPYLAGIVAVLLVMGERWTDSVERSLFLGAVGIAIALLALSVLSDSSVSELIVGYWILPIAVALQAISTRRTARTEASEHRMVLQERTFIAQLARTERRSRLALQAGKMGWYEYFPATRDLEASPELRSIAGVDTLEGRTALSVVLASLHKEDLASMNALITKVRATGNASAEFRWTREDQTVVWIETQVRAASTSEGQLEVVGVAHDITDRKQSEAKILERALRDGLTGLLNREGLIASMHEAIEARHPFSLLLMDLDGFKDVNDTLGHPVGDEVLVAVAHRLAATVRNDDLIARLGGDEFAVVVRGRASTATRVADQLLGALLIPISVDGVAITIRASIGIVRAFNHGADAHTLLRRADAAMYRAKLRGGSSSHVYEPADEHGAARRLEIAGELPAALAAAAIAVHYQPIVRLGEAGGTSVEALVRWAHPRHGVISPSEFVPLAEEYGLGLALFRYVLARALTQAREWKDAGLACAVSVNVSPRTLVETSFAPLVATALTAAGLGAESLVLEITEDAFVGFGPELLESLVGLRDLGVQLAIDDFGTGYSSLAYLTRLPVQIIKLDRIFIDGLGASGSNDAIVALTVQLAHHLNLTVVAEGVETPEALDALRRHGCDAAQGYWVCRPAPGADVTRFLAGESASRDGSRAGHLL